MRARAKVNNSSFALWDLSRSELGALLKAHGTVSFERASRGATESRGRRRFHSTAVSRKSVPRPLRGARLGRCERALYHGVGRDAPGLAALRRRCRAVAAFDPYHPDPAVRRRPRGKFDRVLSIYTLNVLNSSEGRRALADIHSLLRKDGRALIAVRRDVCR